ncbi:MAG: 30S ribosomal protein S20, partial [Candidatus Adiutrix sp.]|nr:30S ribosomal protein S20 [Candidatus Adiutrix sp.]
SALKRARQSDTRRARNRINKTRVKNAVKAARLAMADSPEQAGEALKAAMSALNRAVSKGALHSRNAARRIARLSKQMFAAQPKAA